MTTTQGVADAIAQSLLPEFDQEMAATRRVLERTPEAQAAWQPHPKSMTLGRLADHLAELPGWVAATLEGTEVDLAPPGGSPYQPPVFKSLQETLRTFDENVAKARAVLAACSDADMMVPWSLKRGGETVMTLPRVAVLRGFCLNHLIHHRGQFTVFLRLQNVPLPQVYGPTADSPMM